MKKNTKMIAVLSLTFASTVALVVAGIPSNSFAFADREPYSTEFISNLAKELDTTPNEKPEIKRFISSNGIEFAFETYRCSKDSNNIKIQKGGYIRNITAINGLSKINNFVCSNSSIASFVECEADSDESSFSPTDAFSGDSTCKNHQFSGTNFILKSDGELTVSSLEVCYSCTAGSNGFIYSDAVDNMYSFDNVCEYYGYNADGTQAKPYKISGEEAFVAFARDVNSGNSYEGKYFKLDTDLDFTKEGVSNFIPVGTIETPFSGHFNAFNANSNHLINVQESAFDGFEEGIFGAIIGDAVIENLNVDGVFNLASGAGTIGGIVGYAEGGTIKNCNVSCSINGDDISGLGGILGVSYGNTNVIDCHVYSYIEIDVGCNIGGLIGSCDDTCTVKDSTFEGILMVNGDSDETFNCGGLIGEFLGNYPSLSIQNCSIKCKNCDEIDNLRLPGIDTPYTGLLLGQYEDDYQSYIGCEVGYAENSDYPEILFNPGCWNVDNAWYAVYCWNKDGDYWFKMEKDIASGYYVLKIDKDVYDGAIFVRMKSDSNSYGWENKWNQTNDIHFNDNNNLYSISDWGGEKSPGFWGFYDRYPEE